MTPSKAVTTDDVEPLTQIWLLGYKSYNSLH